MRRPGLKRRVSREGVCMIGLLCVYDRMSNVECRGRGGSFFFCFGAGKKKRRTPTRCAAVRFLLSCWMVAFFFCTKGVLLHSSCGPASFRSATNA